MTIFAPVTRMLAIGLLIGYTSSAPAQQNYPTKPIRLIVSTAPGNSTSSVARLIGQKLTESWGQQVIVDNRAGGNSVIGNEIAAKAPPNGYTILALTTTHIIGALLLPNLPYDSIKDFTAVSTLIRSEFIFVLNPSAAVNALQEFIALARSRPGQFNFATTGSGSITHLAGELFNNVAGVKMQHVPYRGGDLAMTDLVGGHVQSSFIVVAVALPHIKSGRLKSLAITGKTRFPSLPQVPTFAEAGLPDFDISTWYGITAPPRTPKSIVDKLSAEIARILAMPDVRERLTNQGLEPFISTPEQFAALMQSELQKFGKIVKSANIKLE